MHAELIASFDDQRIAAYRHIAHPAAIAGAGVFVAEGRLVVSRLLALDRFRTISVLLTTTAFDALAPVLPQSETPVYIVSQAVMDHIVGFNIHRGCLALAERPAARALEGLSLTSASRLLVLEGVNNPDNVGGLFRSAAAFGAEAVVLGPGCGDPLYRKAIRTSMAATLQVPFVNADRWPAAIGTLRANGIRVLALTTAQDARPLDDVPRDCQRVALLVGNEGKGLSLAALDACDERVCIRMSAAVDSLNVAVAASIAMHHVFV